MKLKTLSALILGLGVAPFAVADGATKLETIEVVRAKGVRVMSQASDSKLHDGVNLGVLGRVNAFTSPVTVVRYDEKMIGDHQPRHLVDGLAKVDASVASFGGESNTLQGVYVRGYQLNARQFSVNGLSGMYSYQSSPTAAVASAQLIKGASTALGGMDPEGAVSGAVLVETKKATDEPITQVGAAWFSNNRVQGSLDVGRRFGENNEWGVRVNSKLRHGNTPRDGYAEDNKEFAFNGDYRGEKLKVAIDLMDAKRSSTGGRARFQDLQNLSHALPAAPDGKTGLVPAWQGQTTQDRTAMLTFDYSTDWNFDLSGGVGYNKSRYWGNFAQLIPNGETGDYFVGARNGNGSRLSDQTASTNSMNLTARGEFETGVVTHHWSAAFDSVRRDRLNYWGSKYTPSIKTNIYNPQFEAASELAPLNDAATVNARYVARSLALSDTLGIWDNRLRLTLGGRLQWVQQHNRVTERRMHAHHLSPMLTAAFVPVSDLTLYGNYLQDLEPGAFNSEEGTMSDPRVSKQVEVGVRKNWGDVVTSLNAFQITRPGYWRGNANAAWLRNRDFGKASTYAGATQGKEQNRGVELSVYANLLEQTLRPSFSVMYLRAKLKDYPTYADYLVNGDQVASPRVIAKAGLEWDIPGVNGLTLTANAQHYG